VVSRDGHLDKLEVRAELRPETAGAKRSAGARAAAPHQDHVGVSTKVTLLPPDGIERTLTGKARRVIDQRPKN
jgi:phenylacetate-CoA ligase